MTMLQKLDKFHKTRPGHLVFGLVELLMAYGFASWAIDTGNLLWWGDGLNQAVGINGVAEFLSGAITITLD